MKVKYVGTAKDYSGYGEAVRHDISALLAAGCTVTGKFPKYTMEIADFGSIAERVFATENQAIAYEMIILHVTPNAYPAFHEPGKYHIARVFWETTKLPEEWARNIEQYADEVWTGSQFNKKALTDSGVTKPIFIIPQALDQDIKPEEIEPYKTINQSDYKFYSMFEWTERKNPMALLEAYWREFEDTKGVSLTIKTYLDNFTREKRAEIDQQIEGLKIRLGLKNYAPLYLYRNLMDRNQVYRFHKTFDAFISAHRGEGWGLPQMEALIMNKPVISTNAGGIHEYLKYGDTALIVPATLIQLSNNSRNQMWYTQDQKWSDVDITGLRKAMRGCFAYPDDARKMGLRGGEKVRELFRFPTVGRQMRDRLEQIDHFLHPGSLKAFENIEDTFPKEI